MFKQAKKSLFLSLFIPTIVAIAFNFISIGVSLSQQSYRDAHAYINTEVLRAKNNFKFNIELGSSSISSLSQNEELIDYLITGNKTNESEIRNTLSNKNSSMSFLLGLSIYSKNEAINPIVSYNISGAVSSSEMLNQNRVKEFLNSENHSLLFIRNDAIHKSYYIYNKYDTSKGICSLLIKLYQENNVVGFAIADFKNDAIYEKMITIPSSDHFDGNEFYIYDNDILLVSSKNIEQLDESKVGPEIRKYNSNKNAIKANLSDSVNLLVSIPKINSTMPVVTISIICSILGILISVGSYFMCRIITKSTINPLEDLAIKMRETSE